MSNLKNFLIVFFVFLIFGTAVYLVNQLRNDIVHDRTPVISGPNASSTPKNSQIPLKMPEGFSMSIFAENLKNPRVLTFDPSGNIVTSLTKQGKVVVLPDGNNDGKADEVIPLIENLDRPHGLAFLCTDICRLYVAETNQVSTYDYDTVGLSVSGERKILDLPSDGRHFTRTIMILPDRNNSQLLVSVGSSCNVCRESDQRRAKILISNLDGSNFKTFASGLRNSVFMAMHPSTDQIWATEMGRDNLGDNLPPDEINIILENKNYGWPTCYGKNIHDTDFDKLTYVRNPCLEPFETESHINIPAHSSPLGFGFFPDSWPAVFKNDLLVAYHGSWNRSEPTGYKIVRVSLNEMGEYLGSQDFITGWLTETDKVIGRPVDILFAVENAFYISDDFAGVIYKVVHDGSESTITKSPPPLANCVLTGCGGQVCSDHEVVTTCEYKKEYECYKDAQCERQSNGQCGWTPTTKLLVCLGKARTP